MLQVKNESSHVTIHIHALCKWKFGNILVNCVDRHAAKDPNRTAIIFEKDEPNQHELISYLELQTLVKKYASILRNVANVKKGDRIAFYLPCGPTALAMALACARIGAIHSIVFAGFSAEALASRINDAGATVVVTADIAVRGGRILDLKKTVDAALQHTPSVTTVLVDARDGDKTRAKMQHPRDHFLQDLENDGKGADVIEYMESNDPLFILYTSGSTGKPKGLVHSTGGYLLYAMTAFEVHTDVIQLSLFQSLEKHNSSVIFIIVSERVSIPTRRYFWMCC